MRRGVAVFAFYLALAVALTWPLLLHLDTAIPDRGDPLLNASIIHWVAHGLTHAPLDLFNAPIYHPAPRTLAFSEHMTGIALIVLPLHLTGLPALTVYNIAILLGFAFSGLGAFVLARVITRNTTAALIGGIIHAFASFKIAHIQHLQIVWSGWLPLLLAALLVYWRRPDPRRAALLAGAFLMNGLTNTYWLLFGGVALVITMAFLQFAEPRRDRAFWLRLIASLGIASLLLLPFLIPYSIVANEYGARRTSNEARLTSALPIHWLVASTRNILYGRFFTQWRTSERELFPGLVAIVLVIAGSWSGGLQPAGKPRRAEARRSTFLNVAIVFFAILTIIIALSGRVTVGRFSFAGADVPAVITTILLLVRFAPWLRARLESSRFSTEEWSAALWVLIGFLGSLGWHFFFHPFLFRVVTPFRATRVPARWAVIALVGIAVWAAIGAAALLARSKNKKTRRLLAVALVALAIADVASRTEWTHVDAQPAPVYQWLKAAKPRAVIEVPLVAQDIPFLYLLAQTDHGVPLLNGTSGWETPAHERLKLLEEQLKYGDAFLANIQPAELLIVHEARLTDEQKRALEPLLRRLRLVRRFGTDAVYATCLECANASSRTPDAVRFRIPRAPADSASAPRESLPR